MKVIAEWHAVTVLGSAGSHPAHVLVRMLAADPEREFPHSCTFSKPHCGI